jgi:hypothetical protein
MLQRSPRRWTAYLRLRLRLQLLLVLLVLLVSLVLPSILLRVAFVLSRQNASHTSDQCRILQCRILIRLVRPQSMLIVLAPAALHARIGVKHVGEIGNAHAGVIAATVADVIPAHALADT